MKARKRKTECKICGNPRDPKLLRALCRPCHRATERENRRTSRATPKSAYRPTREQPLERKFPVGTCAGCGGTIVTDGRCRPCLNAYKAEWVRRKREKEGRGCATKGCAGMVETPYGRLCQSCYRQSQLIKVTAATRARLAKAAPAKQMARCDPSIRRPAVQMSAADIVIGAAAITQPQPVDVRGHRITRIPSPNWREHD